mmetsp:Transcript_34024/g.72642  ORF Transcript_34024/g.72642 Transcript_34024/m.72642 type:complete len:222 (+) Transcript_34024:299-964(+)
MAIELLVEPGCGVPGGSAGDREQHKGSCEQAATSRRRDKAEQREEEADRDHAPELHAAPHARCQQQRVGRWPEHIRMAVLPADLRQQIVGVLGVVPLQVPPHRPRQDSSHERRERHRHGQRAAQREPMHLLALGQVEVKVPPRGVRHIGLHVVDVVGENHLHGRELAPQPSHSACSALAIVVERQGQPRLRLEADRLWIEVERVFGLAVVALEVIWPAEPV